MKKINGVGILIILHIIIISMALFLLIRQKGHIPHGKEKIVVIPLDGVISIGNSSVAGGDSVDALVQRLHGLEEQADVKAVVLRINSPGGSIGAVQEIYEALKKLKSKGKVIVSSFGDIAASGGYYVACAGDKIVSNPGTLTGSIGVIMQMPNIKGLLDKVGVSFETVKSGNFKDSGSPFRAMTEEERKYFLSIVLDAYDQFFSVVKEGRKLTNEELLPLADGRVFSGRMALQRKLVDQMGGLEDAIELSKQLTGLTDKNPEIVFQREKRPLDKILRLMGQSPVRQIEALSEMGTQVLYLMK